LAFDLSTDKGIFMATPIRLLMCIFAVLTLSACGGVVPQVGYSSGLKLSPAPSYTFLARDTLRGYNPLGNDLTNNRIELAIEKTFSARGYPYQSQPSEADLLVSYFVLGVDKQYLVNYNRGVRPCVQCPMSETSVSAVQKYQRGTLIIDLLDPQTQRSVWRGSLNKMIKADQSPTERNKSIRETTLAILAQYPPSP